MYLLLVDGIIYDSILTEEEAKFNYFVMKNAGLQPRLDYRRKYLG